MSIELNVRPDELLAKEGELTNEKTAIIGLMDQAKSEIASLTGVWKSKASEVYQSRFKQAYNDIDSMLATISEYISNLNESAEIYKAAEITAEGMAEGLPQSGVF